MLFLPWVALDIGGPWKLAAAAAPMMIVPLGYMLGAIEAGRVGDMHRPRWIMTGTAIVCTLVCSSLIAVALLVDGALLLGLLFAGAFITSMVTPFIDGAVARTISGSEDVVAGYAWRGAATQSGSFGGPALALIIYGVWGLAAAMMLLAALSVLAGILVRFAPEGEHAPHVGPILQRRVGYQAIARTPVLLRLCAITTLWNVFATAGFALVPILMAEEAGLDPKAGGIITLAGIAAAIMSPVVIGALRHRLGLLWIIALTMSVEACLIPVFGLLPGAAAGVALYFAFMLLNSTCSGCQTALRALNIDPAVRSSVDVAFRTYSRVGAAAGSGAVLLTVQAAGPFALGIGFAVVVALIGVWTLASRTLLKGDEASAATAAA